MEKALLITVFLAMFICVNSLAATKEQCDSNGQKCDDSREYDTNIKDTIDQVRKIIKNDLWFYHDMTIELYESGKIKTISIECNLVSIAAAGITLGLAAGATIYFIGPANIVSALKAVGRIDGVKFLATASIS